MQLSLNLPPNIVECSFFTAGLYEVTQARGSFVSGFRHVLITRQHAFLLPVKYGCLLDGRRIFTELLEAEGFPSSHLPDYGNALITLFTIPPDDVVGNI